MSLRRSFGRTGPLTEQDHPVAPFAPAGAGASTEAKRLPRFELRGIPTLPGRDHDRHGFLPLLDREMELGSQPVP